MITKCVKHMLKHIGSNFNDYLCLCYCSWQKTCRVTAWQFTSFQITIRKTPFLAIFLASIAFFARYFGDSLQQLSQSH